MKILIRTSLPAILLLLGSAVLFGSAPDARADAIESSLGFSYGRSNYSPQEYSWSRRWALSAAYYFTDSSAFEAGFADHYEQLKSGGIQTSQTSDRGLSLCWLQNFTGRETPFRPYVKAGVGEYFRKIGTSTSSGATISSDLSSVVLVGGAGVKLPFGDQFGVRIELDSIMGRSEFGSIIDNLGLTVGGTLFFSLGARQ